MSWPWRSRPPGAASLQVPLDALRSGDASLSDHQILALPGGFSYGDALGAGRLLALDLTGWFHDQLHLALEAGMPIIGICNGFQALVHAGLLPGSDLPASLTANDNTRFECRWVWLQPGSKRSMWTSELDEPLWCPVAHGEGRFLMDDAGPLTEADQVAFRYADADGDQAHGAYPLNPNGSIDDIAGHHRSVRPRARHDATPRRSRVQPAEALTAGAPTATSAWRSSKPVFAPSRPEHRRALSGA